MQLSLGARTLPCLAAFSLTLGVLPPIEYSLREWIHVSKFSEECGLRGRRFSAKKECLKGVDPRYNPDVGLDLVWFSCISINSNEVIELWIRAIVGMPQKLGHQASLYNRWHLCILFLFPFSQQCVLAIMCYLDSASFTLPSKVINFTNFLTVSIFFTSPFGPN